MNVMQRRAFITGLVAFAATPAIVRASSLMPVKVMEPSILVPHPSFTPWASVGDYVTIAGRDESYRITALLSGPMRIELEGGTMLYL